MLGCASAPEELVGPRTLAAPYSRDGGDLVFAVAPLRNESGTTVVDTFSVADSLVAAIDETIGLRALPLNRTIAAMRAIGLDSISTPEEANRLAEALGVDGLVLGSVTAYDPYQPPVLGLGLAIHARTAALNRSAPVTIDPKTFAAQPTEWTYFPGSGFAGAPASVISEHMDARNHGILMSLREYAEGRHDPEKALGWRTYTASMDLYIRFATQYALARLMEEEASRLVRARRTVSR